jgi:serine/threonine-protein kinase
MKNEVEKLFEELVDLSPEARTQYLASHDLDDSVRRDVEVLLHFDAGASAFLQHNVSGAASRALSQLDSSKDRQCGPYRLLELIGSGGMGAVYLAERADGEVSQRVAVNYFPCTPATRSGRAFSRNGKFSRCSRIRISRACWMQDTPTTASPFW